MAPRPGPLCAQTREATTLLKQLEEDTQFLQRHNIMDYSLLIGAKQKHAPARCCCMRLLAADGRAQAS
jgi:hypothetical protein